MLPTFSLREPLLFQPDTCGGDLNPTVSLEQSCTVDLQTPEGEKNIYGYKPRRFGESYLLHTIIVVKGD